MKWKDLNLSPRTKKEIKEIILRLEQQQKLQEEKGISTGFLALFYGSSGTGKTLTANWLSKEVGLPLRRIDLSVLVSKYIGETEKNLSSILEKVEGNNWILFFDEADAIFGKRTGVSSKYANQEVSYLLQRIENYPGLVILSLSSITNIDKALLRQFHSLIHFPKPDSKS